MSSPFIGVAKAVLEQAVEPQFWHDRWASGQIGFHQASGNPLLAKHISALGLEDGARVFLPLCGKTGDIGWLLSQGFSVVGVELSRTAIEDLFDELALEPEMTKQGRLEAFEAENLTVYVGDFFDLDREMLGPVGAIYDRAALVALPDDGMRGRYARHLADITQCAPQLTITFEYPDGMIEGPPFSISPQNLEMMHGDRYGIELLERGLSPGGLRGNGEVYEAVWHLTAKTAE
ncbi:MAG: thiopurine S-methyltransferase [Pseudomonadota bacterium]